MRCKRCSKFGESQVLGRVKRGKVWCEETVRMQETAWWSTQGHGLLEQTEQTTRNEVWLHLIQIVPPREFWGCFFSRFIFKFQRANYSVLLASRIGFSDSSFQ